MSSSSTKHKPRVELPDVKKRDVPVPTRVEKGMYEGTGAVVLGCREPKEGRYDTLSRQTYRCSSTPLQHDAISKDHKERKQYMNNRHFYLEDSQGLVMSETKGTQLMPSHETLHAARHDTRGNMLLMTSSSVFVSDADVDNWRKSNSTLRADFTEPSKDMLQANRGLTGQHRKAQQGTHFSLGSSTEVPNSESRISFTGEMTEKVQKSRVNMGSTINIGSPDVPTSETLRSLKQVDFKSHQGTGKKPQAVRNNLQKHSLVLGYNPAVQTSLYGASFTPTEFYREPPPASPPRKPRY